MKKSILKLISGIFSIGLLFSSCLGDVGGGSIEENIDLIYITSVEYTKVGLSLKHRIYISTDEIQKASTETGYFYTMGYRIPDTDKVGYIGNFSYFPAEDFGQQAKKIVQTTAAISAPTPMAEDNFNPTTFGVQAYSPLSAELNDKWVFGAQASLKQEGLEEPEVYFYYDPARQKEDTNNDGIDDKDLDENQIIIDVRFKSTSFNGGEKTSRPFYATGDLSTIRSYFLNKVQYNNGGNPVYVPIKFRYGKSVTENGQDVVKETLDGIWGDINSAKYGFYYTTGTN